MKKGILDNYSEKVKKIEIVSVGNVLAKVRNIETKEIITVMKSRISLLIKK